MLNFEMKVLEEQWFVVCQPWGDDTYIRAGAPDAAGEFVCDCQGLLDECDLDRAESAAEIAEHIVRLHNNYLQKVRRTRDELNQLTDPDELEHLLLKGFISLLNETQPPIHPEILKAAQRRIVNYVMAGR